MESITVPRAVSMIVHAFTGANATFDPDRPGESSILGAINGLLLEGAAHTPFGNSLPGSGALVAGYTAMAAGSMDGSTIFDWLREKAKELKLKLDLAMLESLPPGPGGTGSMGPGQEIIPGGYYPKPIPTPLPPPSESEIGVGHEILDPAKIINAFIPQLERTPKPPVREWDVSITG